MRLAEMELRRVQMPLVAPFRTSFGTEVTRDILLVRVVTSDGVVGWGECVAGSEPLYSAEYVDAAQDVIERFLWPRLANRGQLRATDVAPALAAIRGHRMAKAAVEMAVLDAELRTCGMRLADYLGATREAVPAGVSVGIEDSVPVLIDNVEKYVAAGYARIKLKIEPGRDVDVVAAVRERFGDVPLQVDANAAYRLSDLATLRRLDDFDLILIEQPLPEEDVRAHAVVAEALQTPICLDESILSARSAADAIALGACDVVNIKAGRVGGLLEARRLAEVCSGFGIPVWCGGMLETGIGRAANLALAALPAFTLPGDTSAADRYWRRDLVTEPAVLTDGCVAVPSGPGLGVDVDEEWLATITSSSVQLRSDR
jgi:o-succinylbenzoate synthase